MSKWSDVLEKVTLHIMVQCKLLQVLWPYCCLSCCLREARKDAEVKSGEFWNENSSVCSGLHGVLYYFSVSILNLLPPFCLNSKASPRLLVRSLSAVKKPRSWSQKSRSLNIISIFPRTKSRTRELLPWIHPMPKYCSSSSCFSSFRSSTSSSSTTTIRPSCQPHQSMGPKWQLSLRKHLLFHYCY